MSPLRSRASLWRIEICCFFAAIGLRVLLLLRLPVMPMGDSYARLSEPTALVKAVWLPVYQATLAVVALLTESPGWLRGATALQGALAAAAGAWCARVWLGTRAAWLVGMGLACFPSFVLPSIALYQEPLFLLFTLSGFALIRQRGVEHPTTLLAFGLACGTRYEAWPLAALAMVGGRSGRRLLLLAVPAAWLLYNGALSPVGTDSLHWALSAGSILARQAILLALAFEWGAGPVWVAAGFALVFATTLRPLPRLPAALVGVLAGVVVALAVLDPYSSPNNARELQLPLVLVLGLAAWGVQSVERPGVAAAAVLALVLAPSAVVFPRHLANQIDPGAAVAVSAGTLLHEAGVKRGVLVLAPGFPQWPDAPTGDCEAIRGYTRGEVRCDHEPDAALDASVDTVVQITRFEPWRPLQRTARAELADLERWKPVVLAPFALWRRVGAPDLPLDRLPGLFSRLGVHPRCEGPSEAALPADLVVDGKAVVREPARLAFYTNGAARFVASKAGQLWVYACGDRAGGRGPRFRVEAGGIPLQVEVEDRYEGIDIGSVSAGAEIWLRYEDDVVDTAGADRNLFVAVVGVVP